MYLITWEAVLNPSEVVRIQKLVEQVHLSDNLLNYVQDLLEFSRNTHHFSAGLSPRAGIALTKAAQAWAYISGRDHVLPEDIQMVLPYVVSHRLKSELSYEEISLNEIRSLFLQVAVPN